MRNSTLALLFLAASSACTAAGDPPGPRDGQSAVVARVDGEPVTLAGYRTWLADVYGQQARDEYLGLWLLEREARRRVSQYLANVLLTGSDCPSMTAADLRGAARALRDGRDAVFCPAEDGGYTLIGLTHAMPALFDAMTWGTDIVMEETRQRLRNLGWHWHELPTHWDVDRPEDYQRLVHEGWTAGAEPGEPI